MKQKILKYFFFSERLCSQACYFLFIFLLIPFPVWRKHSAALQTASVAADDRLMKRVQSLPRWMVLHMQQKALGDVRVVSTSRRSHQRTLNHIWPRSDGRGERPGRGRSHLFSMNVIWYWITVNIAERHEAGAGNTDTFHSHLPRWWLLILYNEHTSGWFQWHLQG